MDMYSAQRWHLFGFSLIVMLVCLALADENEYRLVQDLLRNYDKRIRPSRNASQSMNVTFGLAISQIIDVDEKNQIITTNCWLNQNWLDPKLTWNPDEYAGVNTIHFPYDELWRPDIILYNNADSTVRFSSTSTNIIVTNTGNVTWLSMVIFKSSCSVDVKYFPFDEQNCSMWFGSWTYDSTQINLRITGDQGDTSNYIPNTEWQLVYLHMQEKNITFSCCDTPWPMVVYTIQMRRKPLFYIFNMVLPCNLITLVALLGFYVPSDSGEKITMGITTLLSMTVFLMIVADTMPATSDVLPLIGLYYGITIAIVSFATAMTVFTLNIHHKGFRGKEVPDYIKVICFGFLARILFIRLDVPDCQQDSSTFSSTDQPNMEAGANSSYIRLKKKSNKWMRPETGKTHKTTLDFVPQVDYKHSRVFDADQTPGENGGMSPRLAQRLRNPELLHEGSTNRSPINTGPHALDDFERQFMIVLQKVYHTIERNEKRLADQDRRDTIKLEWQQVALIVDRLLLTLFMGTAVAVTLAILFQAPYSVSSLFGNQSEDLGGFFASLPN